MTAGPAGIAAAGREEALALLGGLMVNWSNNESVLIYLMMHLMGTDESSAAIVYATLNTSRARLDLVRRLARARVRDRALRRRIDDILARFDACAKLRNEYHHSMYTLDAQGNLREMRALRLRETRDRMSFGTPSPFDEHRLAALRRLEGDLAELNRDLWALLPDLAAAMDGGASRRAARGTVPNP